MGVTKTQKESAADTCYYFYIIRRCKNLKGEYKIYI